MYDSLEVDDGDDDSDRILVFETKRNFQLLHWSFTWFIDGPFKTSPNISAQVRNLFL